MLQYVIMVDICMINATPQNNYNYLKDLEEIN